ncbi:MAG TPA: histidine kinase [Ktedonobacteraceae bacterium]|nr:histidine kinase [Ktedonobacteraceae bacterium]
MLDVVDSPAARFVQEAERRRLARELHDGVVQSLTALVADLELARMRRLTSGETGPEPTTRLDLWQELARASLTSMRQVLAGLREHSDAAFDLEASIQGLLTEMLNAGYAITYECDRWPATLPYEYATNLYAIIHESLTNIRKHAAATQINIFVFCNEARLNLSIEDNGVGMQLSSFSDASLSEQKQDGYHVGLIGLRERVALLGGQLMLESAPGKGTRIDVSIPPARARTRLVHE